jgi:hypothetical protein
MTCREALSEGLAPFGRDGMIRRFAPVKLVVFDWI